MTGLRVLVVTGRAMRECARIVRLHRVDVASCLSKPLDPGRFLAPNERTMR